jgi:PAS domain S-box-containing protein
MPTASIGKSIQRIERREWFLWSAAVVVTLLLTLGLTSFLLREDYSLSEFPQTVRGLIGLVLIFEIYTLFQQLQIHRMRRRLIRGEELFRLISENAADMIAVVDIEGKRIFNSFSYERVLGYSLEELRESPSSEQIHPEDRDKVRQAAEEARRTGVGKPLEYRVRHKDGTWRVLESTASVIRNSKGEPDNLVTSIATSRNASAPPKRCADRKRASVPWSKTPLMAFIEPACLANWSSSIPRSRRCLATPPKRSFCERILAVAFIVIQLNIRSSMKLFCGRKLSKTWKWSGSAKMARP